MITPQQATRLSDLRAEERTAFAARQESLRRLHGYPLELGSNLWRRWEKADAAWRQVKALQWDLLLQL